MKTFSMLLVVCILAACNRKQVDTSNRIQVVTDAEASEEVKNFTSPDLALNDLHSKVAFVVIKSYSIGNSKYSTAQENVSPKIDVQSIDTVQFDPSGRMIRRVRSEGNHDRDMVETFIYSSEGELKGAYAVQRNRIDEYKLRITRDANNFIRRVEHIYVHDGAFDDSKDFVEEYDWENGLLKSIGSSYQGSNEFLSYEHDERGLVSESHYVHRNDPEIFIKSFTKSTKTYDYIEFDKCNNWVSCEVCEDYFNLFYDDEEHSSKCRYFIVREIMYIK
jgi:hypothetical protein